MRALPASAATALLLFAPFLAFAADVNISLTDAGFNPRHVVVNPGDRVVWTNNSSRIQSVVSDTDLFSSDSSSGAVFSPGSTYWRTFSTEGSYPYYSRQFGGPGGVGVSGSVTVTIPGLPAQQLSTTASNPTTELLRQQIATLLARVTALQSQLAGTPGPIITQGAQTSSSAGQTTPAATGLQCPQISKTLRLGSTGADVSRLQQFLASDPTIYPEGQVTGYYGALTEAAVKRFQCKNKIVCEGTPDSTGYGITGPRTAALLALQCPDASGSGGASPSGFMRVTPTTGSAPLNTTVELTLNTAGSCAASTFEVQFGDNTQPQSVTVPASYCRELRQTLAHTYTTPGNYTLTLRSGIHQSNASVIVTGGAGGSTRDTIVANPAGGSAPLSVTFTGVANATGQCNPGAYTIQFGDGTSGTIPVSGCSAVNYTIAHTYTAGGTFTARVYKGSPAVETASTNITVTGQAQPTSGGAFNVTAGANGNPLTVQVSFELAASCSRFELDWGDGSQDLTQPEGTCSGGGVTKAYTHTYVNSGSFTLSLKRGNNLQFTDSASVVISN